MKNKKARILISLALTVIMLPLMTAVFCPCAKAETGAELALRAIPCHGCCPQMNLASTACANGEVQRTSKAEMQLGKNESALIGQGEATEFASTATWIFPHTNRAEPGFPSDSSGSPLYLQLQNLRI